MIKDCLRLLDESQIEYIHLGAQKLEDVTCLKFVPYDPSQHSDYIEVQVDMSNLRLVGF